jgi:hypothetical protein
VFDSSTLLDALVDCLIVVGVAAGELVVLPLLSSPAMFTAFEA